MTKRLCLPGISLRIEGCTQCGASSGSSETLGESMTTRLAHVLQIFLVASVSVPVPVPVSAFPCFPVARVGNEARIHSGHLEKIRCRGL